MRKLIMTGFLLTMALCFTACGTPSSKPTKKKCRRCSGKRVEFHVNAVNVK